MLSPPGPLRKVGGGLQARYEKLRAGEGGGRDGGVAVQSGTDPLLI